MFESLMLELQRRIPMNADLSILDHVNSLLQNAILTCKAADATRIEAIQSFETKENINPGQKMDLQWRFTKTTKSPGRKKGHIFRYYIY